MKGNVQLDFFFFKKKTKVSSPPKNKLAQYITIIYLHLS